MIKSTLKNVALSLIVLTMIVVVLVAIDNANNVNVSQSDTYLRVTVVDLDGNPVHNAEVSVGGTKFLTDNKGLSPTIQLTDLTNCYDSTITDWYTLNVVVKKDGFVPAAVFNCVVYFNDTRRLTVKIYEDDGSKLPYVCYVESPPDSFVSDMLNSK